MKYFVMQLSVVVLLTGCGHGGAARANLGTQLSDARRVANEQGLATPAFAGAGLPLWRQGDEPRWPAVYVPNSALMCIGTKRPAGTEAVRIISPTECEVNTNALLAAIEKVQAILERGGVSPYVVNGQEQGLLITGLEVPTGQGYLALANGDVIQAINGQKVPNSRKAIQVLSKAQAQSALDIQFLRGRDSTILSFKRVAPELDGCFAFTYSSFADWVALGRPACWCEPYQCDGDADGKTSGFPFDWRVYDGDLNLILDNWKKKIDDPALDPCADIDHKAGGLQKYRVYTGDLAILVTAWKKNDAELPGDCPRPE